MGSRSGHPWLQLWPGAPFIILGSYTSSVMIAQWDSSRSVLPVARVQFPTMAKSFKGFFPGLSHAPPCAQFREYQRAEWCPLERKPPVSWSSWDAYGSVWCTQKICVPPLDRGLPPAWPHHSVANFSYPVASEQVSDICGPINGGSIYTGVSGKQNKKFPAWEVRWAG